MSRGLHADKILAPNLSSHAMMALLSQVTGLVLTDSYKYSNPLTQNSFKEFSWYWNKFRVSALKNIVVLISNLLVQAKRAHHLFPWLIRHSFSFSWKEVSRDPESTGHGSSIFVIK